MSTPFDQADIFIALGASASPERDFVIIAGGAAEPSVDYIVYYDTITKLTLNTGVILVGGAVITEPEKIPTIEVEVRSANARLIPLTIVSHVSSDISVESSLFNFQSYKYIQGESLALEVSAVQQDVFYLQDLPPFYYADIAVESGDINFLIYNTSSIVTGLVKLSSGLTGLYLTRLIKPVTSVLAIESSLTELKDNRITAITSAVFAKGKYINLRRIPTGYLPAVSPTSRIFKANRASVQSTYTQSGRVVKHLLCSQVSNATLDLEYQNISDLDARLVLSAYNDCFGMRYGFDLPSSVMAGASPDLQNLYNVKNQDLKWFFAAKPTVATVFKGIVNLSVSLKARMYT